MLNITDIKNNKNIGFFRFKKFSDNTYLLTNEIGNFSFLSGKEFEKFISGKLVSGDKYNELLIKGFLNKEIYQENEVNDYKNINNLIFSNESFHVISITNKNNIFFNDKRDFTLEDEKFMDIDRAKKIIDTIFFSSSKNLFIDIKGGEPLFNWETLVYIIEYSKQKAIFLSKELNIRLFSNLTQLNDEKMNYLLENEICICTNFYGNEKNHYSILNHKDDTNFSDIFFWVNKINQRNIKLGRKNNLLFVLELDEILFLNYKEILDLYVDLGLDNIFININNFLYSGNYKVLKNNFSKFYINYINYILYLNKKGFFLKDNFLIKYLSKIINKKDLNYLTGLNSTGMFINQLFYDYNGKIYILEDGAILGRRGDDNFFLGELLSSAELTYKNLINTDIAKLILQASILEGIPGYNESVYKNYLGVNPIITYFIYGNIISNYSKDLQKILYYDVLDYLFIKINEKDNYDIFLKWLK